MVITTDAETINTFYGLGSKVEKVPAYYKVRALS